MSAKYLILAICVSTLAYGKSIQDDLGLFDMKLVLMGQTNGEACLDGSPPGYYISPGYGSGKSNYVVSFLGGGVFYNLRIQKINNF